MRDPPSGPTAVLGSNAPNLSWFSRNKTTADGCSSQTDRALNLGRHSREAGMGTHLVIAGAFVVSAMLVLLQLAAGVLQIAVN